MWSKRLKMFQCIQPNLLQGHDVGAAVLKRLRLLAVRFHSAANVPGYQTETFVIHLLLLVKTSSSE